MAAEAQHRDVGAYVLGALDPAEIESFEAHLATCDSCADQVASLLSVVSLLPTADAETLLMRRAQPRSLGPTRSPVDALAWRAKSVPRHGLPAPPVGRVGRLVAAGILTATVAGGSFAAGIQWSTSDGSVARPTSTTPVSTNVSAAVAATSAPLGEVQRFKATDPTTGANAQLAVVTTAWGSQIELSLGGVRGPLHCQLIAVGADASPTVVASWLVSRQGYGVPEQPERLRIQAATAVSLASTSHFEVRATSPEGQVARLVSIPT